MNLNYIKFFSSISAVAAFIIFFIFKAEAQQFERLTEIPVSQNEQQLNQAWAGGLNNPQFSNADLNNDGIDDLVIFDRKDNNFLTFIKNENGNLDFEYDFNYEKNFPQTGSWALLVDFNCDGIEDLFTSNEKFDYCRVFKGYYENDQLSFTAFADTLKYLNLFQPEDGIVPLLISRVDLPAFTDVDVDGDIDVLTFNPSGGFLEFFQNQSTERGYNCDSLIFEMVDGCFGDFYESGINQAVKLDSACIKNPAKKSLHPGSTILAIDLDADADKEVMLGDISYQNINTLLNGGDLQNAFMVEQDTMFPSYNTPIFFFNFPATFYADVNGDGIRDLLAAPNSKNNSVNVNCSWLYLNIGADNAGVFEFQQDKFLVDQMIDVGESSKPVFFDYDGDGLLDLVVANRGYHRLSGVVNELKSTLTVYKNVGTAEVPAFNLVTTEYLKLNETYDFKELYPTFGDIDADGDEDLIIGEADGFIHLFENTAGPNAEAVFSLTKPRWQNIDVGQVSTPFLFDVDEDGLLDLIIGERNGNLNFYKNEGTITEANFVLVNDFWGFIDVDGEGEVTGYSVPYMGYFDETQEMLLIVGSESGATFAYTAIQNNINDGAFYEVTNNFLNQKTGTFSAIAVADLNNDGLVEIAVGNNRGGLAIFKEDRSVSIINNAIENKVSVYPNPAKTHFTINTNIAFENFELLDAMGRVHISGKLLPNLTVNISEIPQGIYFLKLNNENYSTICKVAIYN